MRYAPDGDLIVNRDRVTQRHSIRQVVASLWREFDVIDTENPLMAIEATSVCSLNNEASSRQLQE